MPRHPNTQSTPARRPRALPRLADFAYRHRGRIVLGWFVALIAIFGVGRAFGGELTADYAVHGSDSDVAQQLLAQRFPNNAGQNIDVVVRADSGVRDAEARSAVSGLLAASKSVPHVVGTSDPYAGQGGISPDGRTALGQILTDVGLSDVMPVADAKRILVLARDAQRPGVRIEVGGGPIATAEAGQVGSEGIGLLAAALILLLTFGSVVAAGLPLLVAVVGLAIGSAVGALLAAVVDTPDWGPSLAAMLGIGVGVDYVLLMVTRFREFLGHGHDPRAAVVATVDSAGRAVLVAGSTVIISLLGLFATDLNYMQGAAVVTIAGVAVIMIAATTLLPALLGLVGTRIDRLRLPGARHRPAGGSPAWARWSRFVQRHPWPAAIGALVILAILALPSLNMRFGFPDAGNEPAGKSARQAYDLVSEGFGPGANGPLLVVADLAGPGQVQPATAVAERLRGFPGVSSVSPPQLNASRDTALLTVVPSSSPQDPATEQLVRDIRDDVVPPLVRGSATSIHVGGATAMSIDMSAHIVSKLPLLIGGVVLVSFLLLLAVFRSVLVAVKAGVMNILSIAAAYGVVAYVLQGGWAGRLIGIDTETPLPAFIPVLMFAVLFGLSMDYEVFLVSRIREFWLHTGDNSRAVAEGLASTARVISAAAAIMVSVFLAFVLSPEVFLKVIGVGLATAIFIDATIVRMLLVPATMQLLGPANWWLPGWLDRRLPQLHVEGPEEEPVVVTVSVPSPAGSTGSTSTQRIGR